MQLTQEFTFLVGSGPSRVFAGFSKDNFCSKSAASKSEVKEYTYVKIPSQLSVSRIRRVNSQDVLLIKHKRLKKKKNNARSSAEKIKPLF